MSAENMNELAQLIERVVPESCCGDDAVDRRNIARRVAFELERRAEDVCQHLVSAARRNEDVPPPWESES